MTRPFPTVRPSDLPVDSICRPVEQRHTRLVVETRGIENPVGGRCRVDVATCLPGLGISVPMKVRKREAELRYTGIDQGIQSQCPGHNEFAVNSRLDGR